MKQIFTLILVLGLLAITGCEMPDNGNNTEIMEDAGFEEPRFEETGALTQELCEEAGGHWNSCGSSCRGASPDTMCIMVCAEMCECISDEQCPEGYECREFIEGTGICKIV